MIICRKYVIQGKVQGVFFRANTQTMANQYQLVGYVRNLPEGHVECVACGPEDQLDEFEKWLNDGPPRAHVTNVLVEECANEGFSDFMIRY